MGTTFAEVYDRALCRFTDYDFLTIDVADRETMLHNYLLSAVSDFSKKSRIDLTFGEGQSFLNVLDMDCVEILSLGVAYYWLSYKVMNSEALRNSMSTRDYTYFSPANLLRETTAFRESLYKEYRNKMSEYTYYGGNIASLT